MAELATAGAEWALGSDLYLLGSRVAMLGFFRGLEVLRTVHRTIHRRNLEWYHIEGAVHAALGGQALRSSWPCALAIGVADVVRAVGVPQRLFHVDFGEAALLGVCLAHEDAPTAEDAPQPPSQQQAQRLER